MKLKTLIAGLAAMAGLSGAAAGSPLETVSTVTPGSWCSNFTASKAYADSNNLPMVVFWASPGCSQCEKLEAACRRSEFKAWMAQRQLVMVFGYGTVGDDMKACKEFAKNDSKAFPYMAVYWKANTAGKAVLERFTGRSGLFGHGTSKSQELWEQFASAVDNILADWTPGDVPPVPTPTPDPTPSVDVKTVYGKAQTLTALVLNDGRPVAAATVKIGRINARKGTLKLAVSGSLAGKKFSSSKTVTPDAQGNIEGSLSLKTIGEILYTLAYDADSNAFAFTAENDSYTIETGDYVIGGAFDTTELEFAADLGDAELPEGYDLVVDPPMGEPVYVKGGTKLSCDKAASIKYKKVDGEYELVGLDDEKKPNLTGLKLTYTAKTGAFKGTFKVYASNELSTEGKPSLKKYTVKVTGFVLDGHGMGMTEVKVGKTTFTGVCELSCASCIDK